MLERITDFSKKEMKKICDKATEAGGCNYCPLNTYIGCFYDFKLNGYLDIYVDTKTLKKYVEKGKGE